MAIIKCKTVLAMLIVFLSGCVSMMHRDPQRKPHSQRAHTRAMPPAPGPARPGMRWVVDTSKIYKIDGDFSSFIVLGAETPLVTVVLFMDYQCPYCRNLDKMMRALLEAHKNDIRVVLVFNPMPYHKAAVPAAMASIEVFRQGVGKERFWAYHKTLFENRLQLSAANMTRWAANIAGADGSKVRNAIERKKHFAVVDSGMVLAKQFGIRGIPAYFVNGKFYQGGHTDRFRTRVLASLRDARAAVKRGEVSRAAIYKYLLRNGEPYASYVQEKKTPRRRRVRKKIDSSFRYKLTVQGRPFIGDPDAPVVMVVAYDVNCHWSNSLFSILLTLLDGDDTFGGFPVGLKIVFLDYPLPYNKTSPLYHEAMHEVFRQKGPEGLKKLLKIFNRAYRENVTNLSRKNLLSYVRAARCNTDICNKALRTHRHRSKVAASMQYARRMGVMGTPTVFLNGRYVRRRNMVLYKQLISEEIEKANSFVLSNPKIKGGAYYRYLIKNAQPRVVWQKPGSGK